jgi:hypothetical protein
LASFLRSTEKCRKLLKKLSKNNNLQEKIQGSFVIQENVSSLPHFKQDWL